MTRPADYNAIEETQVRFLRSMNERNCCTRIQNLTERTRETECPGKTDQSCAFCEVTSSQVSRAAKELDDILDQWRKRPLGAFPYVYLDARYEKVRHNGSIDVAVLVAIVSPRMANVRFWEQLCQKEAHRDFLRACKSVNYTGSVYQ